MSTNDVNDVLTDEEKKKLIFAENKPSELRTVTVRKSGGYVADALRRFRKNRSSVAAAYIIAFLILYAVTAPLLSPYTVGHKETVYTNFPPYTEPIASLGIRLLDGGVTYESRSAATLTSLRLIGEETGMDPIIGEPKESFTETVERGEVKKQVSYRVRTNKYYEVGVVSRVISEEEFYDIQRFQNETGIQVIYPYVKSEDIGGITNSPNIWYKVADSKGTPLLENGEPVPAYSSERASEGAPYDSIRIKGDKGDYIYSIKKGGAVECRVCYYNYYIYKNGFEPSYLLGTNSLGQDLFCAIGVGARFSILFALLVSAVNLTAGIVYGAVQGYYGGTVDLVLDRAADIISGMPFVVVATLFSLHLANRVGTAGSLLFAFAATGWIGMAALTRKQFYRYRGLEFVLAARTLGASDLRLMARHIFPNALGTIVTSGALMIPGVIGSETTLTYLGIVNVAELAGTSLGTLMSQGQTSMTSAPHAMLFPALYFSLLLISFNLFGNGLRDAFNPMLRGAD